MARRATLALPGRRDVAHSWRRVIAAPAHPARARDARGSQHQPSLEGVSRRLAAGSFCCVFVFPINITMISMTMGERRYLRLAIIDDQKRAHLQDPIDRQARLGVACAASYRVSRREEGSPKGAETLEGSAG